MLILGNEKSVFSIFVASTNIFPEINLPKINPLIIVVGIPTINPIIITHPILALIIWDTAMGPGVGGMKAWVVARPASSGMANNSSYLPVFLWSA